MRSCTCVAPLAAIGLLVGCTRVPDHRQAPATGGSLSAAGEILPAVTRLVLPEKVRYAPRTIATGVLVARQQAELGTTVAGTLARVVVTRGQDVREGTLLLSLDENVALAARRQAEAGVATARAQVGLAEDGLARMEQLRREDGASEQQLFQARSQRELARAQLAAAEAQLDMARENLAHHRLVAPFTGAVLRIPDGLGVSVGPGTPLVTMASTRRLVLRTSLTQEEAAELAPGARVDVTVAATGAHSSDAVVSVVLPAVDPSTNRVPVEIDVPNSDGRFKANASARAELPRGAAREAWRVPAAALVQRGGSYALWVADQDGKARALPVWLLAEEAAFAVVQPDGGIWPSSLRVVGAPPVGIVEGTLLAEERR